MISVKLALIIGKVIFSSQASFSSCGYYRWFLKCKLSDLNENDNFINSIDHYNPNINTIEPYHLDDNFAPIEHNVGIDVEEPMIQNNYEIVEQKKNNDKTTKTNQNVLFSKFVGYFFAIENIFFKF